MTTKYSDPLDQAQALESDFTEGRIDHYRRLAAPEQVQNEDGSWPEPECRVCGEDIEEGRLALGKVKCFSCQNTLETQQKRYMR